MKRRGYGAAMLGEPRSDTRVRLLNGKIVHRVVHEGLNHRYIVVDGREVLVAPLDPPAPSRRLGGPPTYWHEVQDAASARIIRTP